MNKKLKRLIAIVLVMMSLSLAGCGKALSSHIEDSEDAPLLKDTWSIYIYMVGGDLEDNDLDELSKLTTTMIEEEVKSEEARYNNLVTERVKAFSEEVSEMGMTLPNVLYNKTKAEEEKVKNTDVDATGYGTYSLNQIMESEIPEGVNFVIQTGGAKRWQSPLVNPNRSQRFLIDNDGIAEVSNEPIVNMADPETLEEFLVFCKEYYPAQHEMVLFWDHGGAYSGFGVDHIFGEDTLTIREMVSALQGVEKLYSSEDSLFDCIGFDACLMGNLETARLFRNYADYYYASPEVLSGLGWGYADIISALYENPSITPFELGKVIAEAYVDNVQLEDFDGVYPATFSLIDLSKIEKVYEAYSSFARNALKASIEDVTKLTAISAAAQDTLAYAVGNSGGYNLLDLGVFADNFAALFPEDAKTIREALAECVPFIDSTTYYDGGSGMSVYFPARMTGLMSLRKYLWYTLDLSDNPDIDALYYYKITGCLNEKLRTYVEAQGYGEAENIYFEDLSSLGYNEPILDGKGNMTVNLTEDERKLIQEASFGLAYVDESNSGTAYFGEIKKLSISADGKVETAFDLTLPSLGQNELPIQQIGETAEKITYRVPVITYDVDGFLIFTRNKQTGEYTILGFALDNDNGTGVADRSVIEFEDGDEFTIVYDYSNIYSRDKTKAGASYVYSKDMKIVDKTLSDGYYYEYIRYDDIRSDIYYSPVVLFRVENGVVTEQEIDYSISASDRSEKN